MMYDKELEVHNPNIANYWCPACGDAGIVKCGSYGRVSCWDGKAVQFRCPWCKYSGEIFGQFDTVSGREIATECLEGRKKPISLSIPESQDSKGLQLRDKKE